MTDEERKAFDLGWRRGEQAARQAAFGTVTGSYVAFDTDEEEEAYDRGYDRGWDSID